MSDALSSRHDFCLIYPGSVFILKGPSHTQRIQHFHAVCNVGYPTYRSPFLSVVTLNNLVTQRHHMAGNCTCVYCMLPSAPPPSPAVFPVVRCVLRDLMGFHWLQVRWVLIRVVWGQIPGMRQTLKTARNSLENNDCDFE